MNKLFQTKYAEGKQGEQFVKEWLKARGHHIIDVSEDKTFQKKDIDFLINGKTAELKTDSRMARTGNMFLEFSILYKKDLRSVRGWFDYTEAEFLFYLDAINRILYIFRTEDIRNYISKFGARMAVCHDGYKDVNGFLINAQYLTTKIQNQVIKWGEN